MKNLTQEQLNKLNDWIKEAEKNNLSINKISDLDKNISDLINNLEYKKTYFPRILY